MKIEKTYFYEDIKTTNKETRIKKLIKEHFGDYNIDSIEEMANWCSVEKSDIIRIAENEFESDVIALLRMAQYFSTNVDHLLGDVKEIIYKE